MLLTLFYILAGLCTGSFLALCADRLPRGESLFFPASHCDACGHRLGFFDLIPLWSYLRLGGRCRYCLAPLKKDLLWWEVGMGGSFALLGRGTAPSPLLFLTFYLFSFLVLISVMDGKEKFVYDASLLFFDWRGSIPSFVRCILLSYGGRQLVFGTSAVDDLWLIPRPHGFW